VKPSASVQSVAKRDGQRRAAGLVRRLGADRRRPCRRTRCPNRRERLDELYDYAEGTVFFKPTLGLGKNTFRSTKQGAISYFVGGEGVKPQKMPG
jgi:hypothetical protein